MDEESKGPDEKGMWTMEGSYVTEEGGKEQFTASVTSRGEVLLTIARKPEETSEKHPLKFTKRRSRPYSLKETTTRHTPKPLKNTQKIPRHA
jgi:molybdenum-dependent DNA-binding transcriptional regulator ModE